MGSFGFSRGCFRKSPPIRLRPRRGLTGTENFESPPPIKNLEKKPWIPAIVWCIHHACFDCTLPKGSYKYCCCCCRDRVTEQKTTWKFQIDVLLTTHFDTKLLWMIIELKFPCGWCHSLPWLIMLWKNLKKDLGDIWNVCIALKVNSWLTDTWEYCESYRWSIEFEMYTTGTTSSFWAFTFGCIYSIMSSDRGSYYLECLWFYCQAISHIRDRNSLMDRRYAVGTFDHNSGGTQSNWVCTLDHLSVIKQSPCTSCH